MAHTDDLGIQRTADPERVQTGPFTIVHDSVVLGPDVQLGSHVVIAAAASVGAGSVLSDGVVVGGDVIIEDGVRIGARACIAASDDRSSPTTVRSGVTIGAGAVVSAGTEVGAGAVVRDGAVVSRQVPRHAVVAGNPAVIEGYTGLESDTVMEPVRQSTVEDDAVAIRSTTVRGVRVHRLPVMRDLRGSLVAGELGGDFPFVPRRWFLVLDVPSEEVRGEHAHHRCHQFLVCVAGQLHVIADDGRHREEFVLEDARTGLYLPPMTWGTQYRYSADCVLMVLASDPYDAADYIRDYGDFMALREDVRHG